MKRTVTTILALVVTSSSIPVMYGQAVQDSADAEHIEEVVLTGYKRQDRRTLTTSISKLDTKALESRPISNVATALQGEIPGLRINQTTGQPGSTPQIQVRGGTDWGGGGTPLILVDGIPNTFFAMNPNDVESIEVLKDAAATAIYGAQGANGVILVTTKKGKSGRTSIGLNTKMTFHFLPETMPYLGAEDYIKYNRLGVKAYQDQMGGGFGQFLDGGFPAATGNNTTNSTYTTMVLSDANRYLLNYEGWHVMDDPITPGQQLIYMANDNYSKLWKQNSMTQDYNVNVSGGTQKSQFYASIGYLDDKGITFGSRMKRMSGMVNASFQIRDNFKVSSNISYIHSNFLPNFLNNEYDLFQRFAGMAPTTRIYYNNPDGSLSDLPHPGTNSGFGNPLYYRDKFKRKNLEQRLSTGLQAEWGFLPDFNLTVRGSFRSVNLFNEQFNKAYFNGGTLIDARVSSASVTRNLTPQLTSFITYRKSFGKHNVDALVGHEYKYDELYTMGAATRGSATDLIYTMNMGAEANGVPTSRLTREGLNSFFTQLNYNFDNRYLIAFNGRMDGSSKLFEGNRYDFFPGVSVGWNMHREAFMQSLSDYVSNLKPRISYGVNGNISSLGLYEAFGAYSGTATYDSQGGFVNTTLPNAELTWERSESLNFGLDLGLFRNRVTLSADHYYKDIDRKLAGLQLPSWAGISSITQNFGKLQVRGWEFGLNANIIKKSDLQWNASATYTSYKSYVKKLPDNGIENNRIGGTQIYDVKSGNLVYVGGRQEGQRVGLDLITAYVFDGVYRTAEELAADADLDVTFSNRAHDRHLGDAKWKDLNGDRIIDFKDRTIIGRATPKFMGGLSTDLTYKGWNLVVRTDFAVGHYKIYGAFIKGIAQTQGAQNGPLDILNTWTEDNPNAELPRYTFTDPMKNHLAGGFDQGDMSSSSSLYWQKASYLALREISLGYNFKGSMFNEKIQSLRLYATGANLHYFTGYRGTNPEFTGNAVEQASFPIPITFTLGLDVKF